MSGYNINSLTRISGLSSGIDTESIIKSLMKAEELKLDKLTKQKTLLEWRRESILEINNLLRGFREKFMSVLSPDTNMFTESAYKVYSVNMPQNHAVSITASSNAVADSHVINSISQLAQSASATGTAQISDGSGINVHAQLKDLALSTGLIFENGEISFEINGHTFTFSETDTLYNVFNTVNASGANVIMNYSSLSDKITIKSKTTGSSSIVNIVNLAGNAFADENSAFKIAGGEYANGKDAVLNIDGHDITRSSNTFTIDGITYELKDTTTGPVKFSISYNIDLVVDKIKTMIIDYNLMIDILNGKISEKKYYDYPPLTDAQKDEMKETEIQKWEEKAKSGILYNDKSVSKLLSTLRMSVYDKVEGIGKSLADIGIKTGAYYEKGKLVIDETVLRNALYKNPDEVAKIFASASNSTDRSVKYKNSGFLSRVSTAFIDFINGSDQGETDKKIRDYEKSILDMQVKLFAKENKYWIQFSQMEQALYRMSYQMSWFTQQIQM